MTIHNPPRPRRIQSITLACKPTGVCPGCGRGVPQTIEIKFGGTDKVTLCDACGPRKGHWEAGELTAKRFPA